MTQLRIKPLALAVAFASCGIASTAMALDPSAYDGDELNVFYSGATATDNALEALVLSASTGFCDPTDIDVYRVTATNQTQRVIFCTAKVGNTANITPGTQVAFHKESIGGSSNAITPIARAQTVTFYNMNNAASCAAPTTVAASGDRLGYDERICPVSARSEIPNGGLSDTEPQIGEAVLTTAELARITPQVRTVHVVFGIAASCNLYRALQRAQGLTPTDCSLQNAPKDAESNIPSLTSAQIRGIVSGRLTTWDQIHVNGTDLVTAAFNGGEPKPVNAAGAGNPDAPPDNSIFLCRRVNSSGTQATFESYWLNQRCDATRGNGPSPAFRTPNDGSTTTAGAAPNAGAGAVNASESSTDIRTCMAYHVDVDGAGTDTGNGTWALGMLSTEVTAANMNSGQFRFIKVDGYAPNLANVANGDYTFFSEGTAIRQRATFAGSPPNPSGDLLDVLTFVEGNLGRESLLANINVGFQGRPHGDGGLLGIHGLYGNLAAVRTQVDGEPSTTVGSIRDNPVNTMSRAVNANRTNNCYPPIMVRPSPTP